MSRVYSAVFSGVSVSVVQDLFELTAGSGVVVRLHEVHISQDSAETSEQLAVSIKRIMPTATSGSGGSAVTPAKLAIGDPSATSTVERNNTTQASSNDQIVTMRRHGENVLNGWHWVFTPESRIDVPPSGMIVVSLENAPSGALTMSGELIFEEIG